MPETPHIVTDAMTAVRRDARFKEIVRTMEQWTVSALPVLEGDGRVIGVVSEADLLRKSADQAAPSGRTPIRHLEAWERAKAEGARAEELMSAPAVCARPEWSVVEAARLMEVHNVKRLPVVDETDRLQGIVSRRDLLRVFLRRDDAIRDEITRYVLEQTLGFAPEEVTAEVREGQVNLGGSIEFKSLIPSSSGCAGALTAWSRSPSTSHRIPDPGCSPRPQRRHPRRSRRRPHRGTRRPPPRAPGGRGRLRAHTP